LLKIFVLTETDFIFTQNQSISIPDGSVTWKTPSNIALVKYWGKKEPQIPENTSISFTLNACFTTTTLEYRLKKDKEKNDFTFEIYFEAKKKGRF
jgi:diphosphomevalonate decarboxylase